MKDSCSDAFDQYNGVPLGAGEKREWNGEKCVLHWGI